MPKIRSVTIHERLIRIEEKLDSHLKYHETIAKLILYPVLTGTLLLVGAAVLRYFGFIRM